jgi:hypothetical protein
MMTRCQLIVTKHNGSKKPNQQISGQFPVFFFEHFCPENPTAVKTHSTVTLAVSPAFEWRACFDCCGSIVLSPISLSPS